MIDFITLCDYVGTFAFAISGIRLASAKQFDWFGAYVVGLVTAVLDDPGFLHDRLRPGTPFRDRLPEIRHQAEQHVLHIRRDRFGPVYGRRFGEEP